MAASVHLLGTGKAFAAGMSTIGTVLGVIMVATASVPVTTGYCIPSFLYGLMVERPATA